MGIGCGILPRCTCHMTAAPFWVPYRITSTFNSTVMCVAVNVDVQPSSNSCPMEINAPNWRWGKIFAVFELVDNKGIRLSSDLWVSYMRITSGRITCGPCCVLDLFKQDVSSLM